MQDNASSSLNDAWKIVLIATLIIAAGIGTGLLALRTAPAVSASAPPASFSAERARTHLAVIAAQPHPMGSPSHARVREYLLEQLNAAGLQPDVQRVTAIAYDAPFISAGAVENIAVRIAGASPTHTILIVAHYDSVPQGPGANDDGVAVAAMLETIRTLRSGPALQNTIIFLFTDGEEAGLLGAEAFVSEHPWAEAVDLVINFEARGAGGPALMFETSAGNAAIIDGFIEANPRSVASSLFGDIYRQLPNDSDFTVFKQAGIAGFNIAYIDDLVAYHSARDSLANVDDRMIQQHGDLMLTLGRYFGMLGGSLATDSDAVYFNLIGTQLIRYPRAAALPLAIVIALLTLGAIALGLRAGSLRFKGMALGFTALPLLIGLAVLLTQALWLGVQRVQPMYDFFVADVPGSHIYLISLSVIAVATVAAGGVLAGRYTSAANLMAGALMWWMLLLIITTILLPGGSYLLAWPLAAASLGLAVSVQRESFVASRLRGIALLGMCGLPGLILLTPIIALIFIALGVRQAYVSIVLVGLACGLFLPLLVALGRLWRGTLIGAGLALGIGIAVFYARGQAFDANNPVPASLAYALDAERGEARWITSDSRPNDWSAALLSAPVRGPIRAWYPYSSGQPLQSPAPPLDLPAPEATLVDESSVGGMRVLRIRIRSPRRADTLLVYLAQPTTVLTASLNGRPLEQTAAGTVSVDGRLAIRYWAPGPDGIDLTLGIPADQPLTLILADESYALPPAALAGQAPRPAMFMTNPYGFADMTIVSNAQDF